MNALVLWYFLVVGVGASPAPTQAGPFINQQACQEARMSVEGLTFHTSPCYGNDTAAPAATPTPAKKKEKK